MFDENQVERVTLDPSDINSDKKLHTAMGELVRGVNDAIERGDSVAKMVADHSEILKTVQTQQAAAKAFANRPTDAPRSVLRSFVAQRDMPIPKQGTVKQGDAVCRGFYDTKSGSFTPGLFDQNTQVDSPWLKDLRNAIGNLHIVCAVRGYGMRNAPKTVQRIAHILKQTPAELASTPTFKALTKAFVDGAGLGAEWIIDLGIVDLLDNTAFMRGPVRELFATQPMAAGTIIIPAITRSLRPYKYSATTSDDPAAFTSSNLTTAQRTLTAVGLAVMAKLDRDAEEDAIIAAAPEVRKEMLLTLRDGVDDCIINGAANAAALHTGIATGSFSPGNRWGTSGLGGADDHRFSWSGLMKYALTNNGASGASDISASMDYDGYQSLLGLGSGRLGMPGSSTAWIMSRSAFFRALRFSEYKTAEKVLNLGTNEGAGINFAGFPTVVTDFMSNQLNVAGVFDGVTETKTGILAMDTSRFVMRERLGNVIEADLDIAKNQRRVVGRFRGIFAPSAALASADTNVDVVYGYNITS